MKNIGSRIRTIRKYLKKSHAEFAEALGLNHAIISVWELDKIEIGEKTIKAIGYTFKVNAKWLRFGEDKMFYEKSPLKSELFDIFYEFNPNLRDVLISYAKGLWAAQQASKEPRPIHDHT